MAFFYKKSSQKILFLCEVIARKSFCKINFVNCPLRCPVNASRNSSSINQNDQSASLQHLNHGFFRTNIRTLCPTIVKCYYWHDFSLSIRNMPTRKLFKKALCQFYFAKYLIVHISSFLMLSLLLYTKLLL